MRTPQRVGQVRDEAIALRRAGKSVREIKDTLGPVGKRTLSAALKGTPPAEWTRRPNAKDDLREQARELRIQGLSYNEIVAQLGVSKSSVSLWVRDIPCPERFAYVHSERRLEGLRKYNEARLARYTAETEAAAAEIGSLTDREILIAGRHCLLVRRHKEQALPSGQSSRFHEQRPWADQILSSVPRRCRRRTEMT